MRWPWQRVAADDGGRAQGSGDGAAARAAGTDSTAFSPAGWAFLPPMQRQIADAPPATLRAGWVDALPTRVIPSRVAELTHVVDSAAPAGTVAAAASDLGVPVQRAAVADLTLRPPQTAAEQARERRVAVQRQAASAGSTPSPMATTALPSIPPSAGPIAEARTAVQAESEARAEGAFEQAPVVAGSASEPAMTEPAIGETSLMGERMPVADASEQSIGSTANADPGVALVPPDLSLPSVQRLPAEDVVSRTPAPPTDESASAHGLPAASDPVEMAETPTIAGAPPERDPGRFGLAAPLPRPSTSPTALPAQPSHAPAPVQRSTAATQPGGRRMGLGAPLPAGGRIERSAPGSVPIRGAETGSVPEIVPIGTAAEDGPTSIPSTPAVQREATAAPDAAVSPSLPAMPTARAAGGDPGAPTSDGGEPSILGDAAERPVGFPGDGDGDGDGAGAGGLAPVAGSGGWAAPVDLVLQRTSSRADGEAQGEVGLAASDVAPDGGSGAPADDRAPAPLVVPLIAQRALESSFETVASSSGPVRPRAVPATAVTVDPLPSSAPGFTAAATVHAAAIQRQASSVHREAGAPSGSTGPTAPSSERAPAAPSGSSGGVFGWVQRTLGLSAPRSTGAADAPLADGGFDAAVTPVDDPFDGIGMLTPVDDATGAGGADAVGGTGAGAPGLPGLAAHAADSPARPGTTSGSGAPALVVSRLAASDARAPARSALAGTAPGVLRNPAATPVAVQRAPQTIAGPPAVSASRMVLPVVPPAPPRRSEGGAFDGPDAAAWSDAAGWSGGTSTGPVVQTAVDPGSAPPAEPPGETASAPAAGGAAAAAGGAPGGIDTSPAGIETLAARLYGPLARRLKAELLLDRERRGIRIDGI